MKIPLCDPSSQEQILTALKKLLEECAIPNRPRRWGYVYVIRSHPLENGTFLYKIGHSIRGNSRINELSRSTQIPVENPVFLFTVGNAAYFAKVLRRAFRDKRSDALPGRFWFKLTSADLAWLQQFKFADAYNLPAKVTDTFDFEQTWELEREGLDRR